jgi:aspartyl protease family protein
MLRFAVYATVGAVFALGAAQAVVAFGERGDPPVLRRAETATAPLAPALASGAEGQAASVAKSSDGHYWAEALVNGKRVRFLVDTGATAVALTSEDAQRLGIRLADLDYSANVTTANGQAHAAQVTLASVSVAGARVSDVQALVIDKGLPTSLLGMTYLGRLSRFEATQSALILRP